MNGTRAPLAILGAGAWGTALAIHLARNGTICNLWDHDREHLRVMQRDRSAARLFPNTPLPDGVILCEDLDHALRACHDILVVVPSQVFRSVLVNLKPKLAADSRVVWASKGLEAATGKLLHEIANEELGVERATSVISGPTFAHEVAMDLPTALVVASRDEAFSRDVAARLHGGNMRAYTSTDVPGVELGGAVKNVLAIGAGICDGLGFGANSRAALITRGLAELMRLGEKLECQRETLMGLAGVGDLILTCTDDQSRNRRLGLALGRGAALDKALADIGQVVEGVETARAIVRLESETGIEMPISHQIYQVLHESVAPKQAVHNLLTRSPKAE